MGLRSTTLVAMLILSGLLLIGSGDAGARPRRDSEDLLESRKVADRFLQHLKDEDYDAAYGLGTPRFKSLVTRDNLETDVRERQGGGAVKSWRLKAYEAREGRPRYMLLLYHVEGSRVTGDWKITMELWENPYQWRIWSLEGIDDSPADRDAQAARATAEQFLRCLKDHAYQIAARLYSLRAKRPDAPALRSFWEETEGRRGALVDWTLRRYSGTPAVRSGDIQDHVVLVFGVRRARAEDEAVFTMVKMGTQWRIERIDFMEGFQKDIPAGQ